MIDYQTAIDDALAEFQTEWDAYLGGDDGRRYMSEMRS